MQPAISQEVRPPYIEFKKVPVEDRQKTIEVGHPVFRDVDFVEITPLGSRDKLVKEVTGWLAQSFEQAQSGRLPMSWYQAYKGAYEFWQKGQELPVEGTPIKNWPTASAAEVENCLRLHLRSVEDLASANEEAIMRLGMGGRALKQRAIDYLNAARDTGQVIQQLTALKVENDALKERNKSLEERLTKLEGAAAKK
jgi:hypothetical protein